MAAPIVRRNIPSRSKHELRVERVSGKPGEFTAAAIYCKPTKQLDGWGHDDICTGPKRIDLAEKGSHVIEVVISFDKHTPDECMVISILQLPDGSRAMPAERRLVNNTSSSDRCKITLAVK